MPRLPLLGLALGFACTKASKDDDKPSTPPTQRERCEALAHDATRTAGIAVGVMAAGLSDKGMSEEDRKEIRGAMQNAEAELVERCLGWDDEVFECFGLFSAGTERCERILEVAMGGTVAPEHVPEGPAAAWTYALPGDPQAIALLGDTVVAALSDARMLGVADGKQTWEQSGIEAHTLASPPPGSDEPIIALTAHEVLGLGADGSIRFRKELPLDPATVAEAEALDDDDADLWVDKLRPVLVARHGSQWLLGDDSASLSTLSPSGELAPRWRLPDETFDTSARLYPLADGSVLLHEDENLRRIDGDGRVTMDVRALDDLSVVLPAADGTVALRIDDDLLTLNLDACRSAQPFAPSGFPQPGRFVYVDEDLACGECVPPPSGCVTQRTYLESWGSDLLGTRTGAPTIVESMDGLLGIREGQRAWGHAMSAESTGAVIGDHFLFVGQAAADPPEPLRLWSLGFDGEIRWAAALGEAAREEGLYWSDAGRFVVQGSTAVVVLRRSLSVFAAL